MIAVLSVFSKSFSENPEKFCRAWDTAIRDKFRETTNDYTAAPAKSSILLRYK
ncbi:MAG: hypothetical protein AB4426_03395 [Xenococcaceae cyanobacterium]